jgi:ATP/maltotriose-dependent transcriptional regulator MalT
MSRIEASLLSRIAISASSQERAVLCSRLAIYYFHKGDSDRALRLVDEVRDWARSNEALNVMVYINLAEATDRYQSAQTNAAIEKAKRAYALSSASGRENLIALSAIWLAHLEFNEGHYADAVKLTRLCLKTLDRAEALTRTRCHTLVADLLSFCGKMSDATLWYARARSAAVDEGDEIAIGQIIYNSAAFRFNNVRLSKARGEEIGEQLRLIEMMIGSSSHYDVGVKSSAFKSFLPMLNAQLMMLRGDYINSSRIFSQWLKSADTNVDERVIKLCQADFALCLASLGDVDQAVQILDEIDAQDHAAVPPDEVAISYHQRSVIHSIIGNSTMSKRCLNRSKVALEEHERVQSEILSLISSEISAVLKEAIGRDQT